MRSVNLLLRRRQHRSVLGNVGGRQDDNSRDNTFEVGIETFGASFSTLQIQFYDVC
jgi:NADH:ubiquinone oxidoreductase subunit 3 (subunit A)